MIDNTHRDAKLWQALKRMAGHTQNSSERAVKFSQDDATHSCILTLGTDSISQKSKSYYGRSFEDVMLQAVADGQAEDDL